MGKKFGDAFRHSFSLSSGTFLNLSTMVLIIYFISGCSGVKSVIALANDEKFICNVSIPFGGSEWSLQEKHRPWVVEAKRRGLSIEDCARINKQDPYRVRAVLARNQTSRDAVALGSVGTSERSAAEAERKAKERKAAKVRERSAAKAERKAAEAKKEKAIGRKRSNSGSGFFISRLGHIVTNEHVVAGCKTVSVGDNSRNRVPAEILQTDRRNDLALLKLTTMDSASDATNKLVQKLGLELLPSSINGLLRSEEVALGESVMVAGYPYGDIFSDSVKVTRGIVSSERGVGDDSAQFQIDAAVQPGNSGGPIYDRSGNLVGVVVAQLDKFKVAKIIGSLPENVNFGIKASTVQQFLKSAGLPIRNSNNSKPLRLRDLAQVAKAQTLMVVCEK